MLLRRRRSRHAGVSTTMGTRQQHPVFAVQSLQVSPQRTKTYQIDLRVLHPLTSCMKEQIAIIAISDHAPQRPTGQRHFATPAGNTTRASLLLLTRRTTLKESLSHLSVAPSGHKTFSTVPLRNR